MSEVLNRVVRLFNRIRLNVIGIGLLPYTFSSFGEDPAREIRNGWILTYAGVERSEMVIPVNLELSPNTSYTIEREITGIEPGLSV